MSQNLCLDPLPIVATTGIILSISCFLVKGHYSTIPPPKLNKMGGNLVSIIDLITPEETMPGGGGGGRQKRRDGTLACSV